eukprot:6466628-Amphidinium_carterae.1
MKPSLRQTNAFQLNCSSCSEMYAWPCSELAKVGRVSPFRHRSCALLSARHMFDLCSPPYGIATYGCIHERQAPCSSDPNDQAMLHEKVPGDASC